ncbi:unnamed protein product [Tuber aestivum]|uniref:Uncharacterized protein n=1 Tax=Tuber aestivum TaxID=59557 RepID=A0A292PKX3_9PEZI|nr:unnamed protein product [Tuber aestivum]
MCWGGKKKKSKPDPTIRCFFGRRNNPPRWQLCSYCTVPSLIGPMPPPRTAAPDARSAAGCGVVGFHCIARIRRCVFSALIIPPTHLLPLIFPSAPPHPSTFRRPFCFTFRKTSEMALARGTCPSGYNWYVCANPAWEGCCSVDACSAAGCPPGSQLSADSSSQSSRQGNSGSSAGSTSGSGLASKKTRTVTGPVGASTITATTWADRSIFDPAPTPTFASSTFGATSATASGSPTNASSGPIPDDTNPTPHAVIVGAAIGGALIILIVILAIILCRRRRRKSKDSASGLLALGGDPEPLTGGGVVEGMSNPTLNLSINPLVTKSPYGGARIGFLAFFKRTRPVPAGKATTAQTGSPSTTYTELPSPSFPQSSRHNSIIPGFAELASPPMSSVSELSSGDPGVYSSTNVSTASTGAVVSRMPHETLRGGDRPVMRPNMTPHRREGRKHVLSWQSLEPGNGC